jgi:hypothetical protein
MIKTVAEAGRTLTTVTPSTPAMPSLVADRYEIASELGAGGMGRVFLAHDRRLRRDVAIKMLSGAHGEEAIRRFEVEARAAGSLNHPHILSVHDIGTHEGAPFIVSELLEGQTLRSRLAHGALPLRKTLDLAVQLARGLSAAHEKGVIHRDLKPENLFLTGDGRLKILDFGIAKLVGDDPRWTNKPNTDTGTVMGTVGYMSPEQVRGEHADHRSDIFSFGVILYEMLAGLRAFERPAAAETGNAILHEEPKPLPETIPDQVRRAVERCLEKDPAERLQSARDLAFLLEGLSATSGPRPAQLPPRRRWLRPAAAGALLLASGILAGRQLARPRAPLPVRFHQLSHGHVLVDSSRIAPDGATVVYSAAPEAEHGLGNWAVWTVRIDAPRPRKLLDDAMVRSISASGELLLLLHPNKGHTVATGTLARMPLAGGAPRELATGVEDADWLPDGTSWALIRSIQGKRTLEFPAGHPVFETPGTLMRVRVSPDGRHVAFFDQPVGYDDRGYVAVATRDGKVRRLTAEWFTADGLAWNGNDEIYFSASRTTDPDVYAVSLGGSLRHVQAAPGRLVIDDLRAGAALLHFELRRGGKTRVHLPGGAERDVDGDAMAPADIAPDGTVLLTGEAEGDGPSYGAWVQRPGEDAPARLGDGVPVAFSPDYRSALIVDGGANQRITLVPLGAGEPRRVPIVPGLQYQQQRGGFFPDGKRLLLLAGRPGETLQYGWQAVDGQEFHPLGPAEAYQGISLSPDGKTIATTISRRALRFAPVDGGPSRDLATSFEPAGTVHRWSRDGKSVYTGRVGWGNHPAEVRVVDVETGKSEPVAKIEVPPGFRRIAYIAISDDGRAWAYARSWATSRLVLAENLP